MTRAEHLAWAKRRAIEYIDAGDLKSAVTSFASDLGKHPGTASEGRALAKPAIDALLSDNPIVVRRFIEGVL